MILIIIIAIIAFALIGFYNTLVSKRNHVDNTFAQIDVQLKKRYDLIPNIVATVREFAEHELEVFTSITKMRSMGYENMSASDKVNLDSQFQRAAMNFRAVAENYPELKSSQSFDQLQRALNETEEQLSAARRTFNAAVTDYNTAIQTFPGNLFASYMNFTARELLSIPEEERKNVNVRDLFKK